MYHFTHENSVPTGWGPYTDGYMSNQILPQNNQMCYNQNEMNYNANQMHYNTNQMYYNANKMHYNTNQMHFNTNQMYYNANQMRCNVKQRHYNTNQRPYNANQMDCNVNQRQFNSNQIHCNTNRMRYNTNPMDYRVPTNYHSPHFIKQQAISQMNMIQRIPPMNIMQPTPPVNVMQSIPPMNVMEPTPPIPPVCRQSLVTQEPPVKRRCISLETFMQNRRQQQQKLRHLEDVTKQIGAINAAQNNSDFNQPDASCSAHSAGVKLNSVQKTFASNNSDSSGVSSGGTNFHEPKASQIINIEGTSGQISRAANSNPNEGYENELLRIAIQCGSKPRLQKFIFQVDNMLREDFALDHFDTPNPIVRMSRFKFNWIFQEKPQMSRKFKQSDQPKSSGEASEAEKSQNLFTIRQKCRIATAISDIEEFLAKKMIREKMYLISKYRAYHKILKDTLQNAGIDPD